MPTFYELMNKESKEKWEKLLGEKSKDEPDLESLEEIAEIKHEV